jgi:hypothetical protein
MLSFLTHFTVVADGAADYWAASQPCLSEKTICGAMSFEESASAPSVAIVTRDRLQPCRMKNATTGTTHVAAQFE